MADVVHRFTMTVAEEDYVRLRDIAGIVGSTVPALIRELLEENRATFNDVRASLHDALAGRKGDALARMNKRLEDAINRGEDLHVAMRLMDE